jgi:hypothetical protein
MNFHKLVQEQLLMFTVATDILFGKLSVGSQCLKALLNMMSHYKSIFKAKERLDKEFPAKFLFAVDTRFQIWLNNCKSAKFRNKVDDSIINFRPLINQVIFGSFNMNLPPNFLNEGSKRYLDRRNRSGGQMQKGQWWQRRQEEKQGKQRETYAGKKSLPPQWNLRARYQNMGWKFCGQAPWPTPELEWKVQVLPSLVPSEILFLQLPKRGESRASQEMFSCHSSEVAGVGQSVPQLMGRVGV